MGWFEIDILQFIVINSFFVISVYFTTKNISNKIVKILSIFSFALFHFYNGLGLANISEIDYSIIFKYFIFLSFYQVTFLYTYKKYKSISYKIQKTDLSYLEAKKFSLFIIVIFNILYLTPFILGNVSIVKLILPDAPSLFALVERAEMASGSVFDSLIVQPLKVLLLPIYFISLYTYRKNKRLLLVLILLPLYLKFAATGYIGRSRPFTYLLIYILYLYLDYPKYRKTIIISVVAIIPLFITFMNFYTYYRKGIDYKVSTEIFEESVQLYFAETRMPSNGYILYKHNETADLDEYLKWALTLPLPTFIKGNVISGVGYEMSEKIRLQSRYSKKYSVDLVGGFYESFYIYGKSFFFLHAIIIGFLMGLLFRIFSSNKIFLLLLIYIAFQFGYFFGRAASSSLLPTIINKFLLIYIILIFSQKTKKNVVVRN